MAAPSTSSEFLDLVRKSGVVDDKRLDAYLQRMRAVGALPDELGKLAGVLVRDAVLTHFQAEQFLLGKWRRFTIGKYKVLERVGAGGMGSVYLCEHKFMRRRVAVKVLPMAKAEDSSALERFYREARAVAALDHPNIVRAYDIDQDDKLHFLVMEYVDGANLQEIVKRFGPMDPTRAAHYMRQAAAGLQHAHQTAGLIHRDIKPGNVLVDRQGVVKVLDMGLARFFHDEEDVLTKKYDENVLGTADYLAPEQALDSHNVDIRADIYSLGATFYFCLTGNTPFTEGTVAQKLIWHQTRQPKKIHLFRTDVPEGLAGVIERMMAKDPGQRYQTPGEVMEALAPWTREPIAPPPEREMPRLSPAAMCPGGFNDGAPVVPPAPVAAPPSPPPRKAAAPLSPSPRPSAGRRMPVAAPVPAPRAAPQLAPAAHNNGRASLAPATPGPGPRTLEEDTSSLSWDRLARHTVDPSARLDTAPRSVREPRPVVLPALPAQSPWVWVAVGFGIALLLLTIVWLMFGGHRAEAPSVRSEAPPAAPSTTLIVTRAEVPGAFKTVDEALTQAHPGDRIVVQDETLEEDLILEDGRRGKQVTIESGFPGKPVRWTCPANRNDKFIVLANLEGLHVKGFILDGQNRVADLIALSSGCPGLVLEDVQLQGFNRAAVTIKNCVPNLAGDGITFQDIRTTTAKEAQAALLFQVDPKNLPAANRRVTVRNCCFEGPYKAAVELAGPIIDMEFQHNRFWNCDAGLLYRKAIPYPPIRLSLFGNTFANIRQAAMMCECLPLADSAPLENRIGLEKNLFMQTAALVRVDEALTTPRWTTESKVQVPVSPAHWIWFGDKSALTTAPAGSCYFRKTFAMEQPTSRAVLDVGCDDQFTAWLNGTPIGSVPKNDQHVHTFDVAKNLVAGRNVLAVQATNVSGPAGLVAELNLMSGGPPLLVSDATWKAAKEGPAGWEKPAFDDSKWLSADDLAAFGQTQKSQWDSWVWDSWPLHRFLAVARLVFPGPTGNVRDPPSQEGNVSVDAMPLAFTLPTDPSADRQFLRYPKTHPLAQAGPGKTPVGVPPPESE
jgi:serine/threonine protein kinase